jgi:cyclic pyranopterin phosphate synthase
MKGIESAMAAGLSPVKLNVVLTDALTPRDLAYFVELVITIRLRLRFIEYMPIGGEGTSRGRCGKGAASVE